MFCPAALKPARRMVMTRFLGVECPNCTKLFAVARFEGAVNPVQLEPMVLQDVNCPHCRQYYPQLTAEVVEFEAEESPISTES